MRVALMVTCLVDQFFAGAGADAVRLLRSLGCEVVFPPGQTCCGQPAFNAGYRDEARRVALHTLDVFEDAEAVVLPSGSCTAMVRLHYPELFSGDEVNLQRAEALASRTYELAEFLVKALKVERLGGGLREKRVAYHHGCHALRGLGLREEPLTLLKGAGAEVVEWPAAEECCGFGGVFAVKFPEVSVAMADRKLDTLPAADFLTSADPGCLLHLKGRMASRGFSLPVKHLAEVLWKARREA
jgi:L-lactate dehydrogenase complex protein LldE